MAVQRTTVRLDSQLLRDAKRFAADTHRTLTSLIEDALREVLARKAALPPKKQEFKLITFDGKAGLQPGVDLDNSAALLDLMEEDDPPF